MSGRVAWVVTVPETKSVRGRAVGLVDANEKVTVEATPLAEGVMGTLAPLPDAAPERAEVVGDDAGAEGLEAAEGEEEAGDGVPTAVLEDWAETRAGRARAAAGSKANLMMDFFLVSKDRREYRRDCRVVAADGVERTEDTVGGVERRGEGREQTLYQPSRDRLTGRRKKREEDQGALAGECLVQPPPREHGHHPGTETAFPFQPNSPA